MADKGTEDVLGEIAKTQAQKNLIKRKLELQQWRNNSQKLRGRNLITGLTIGAFVVGMCILSGVSSQQAVSVICLYCKVISVVDLDCMVSSMLLILSTANQLGLQ